MCPLGLTTEMSAQPASGWDALGTREGRRRCPGQKLNVQKPDVESRPALHPSPLGAAMILVLGVWTFLRALLGRSTAVTLENVALRHQLTLLPRSSPRPRLRRQDRILWVCLSRLWANWRSSLLIVQPATVVAGTARAFDSTGVGSPDSAHRAVRRSTSRSAA
jgi:hypothetical protein